MDWQGVGLTDEVIAWLERTAERKQTKERRLDPFATSMRDLDDVAPQLSAVEVGGQLAHSDVTQRVADLRAAGLLEDPEGVTRLTDLGAATLAGWRKWDVAGNDQLDELARTLVVYGEARRSGASPYSDFFAYWSELRAAFDPVALIDSWDALFTLNYLDLRHDGFAPGDAYRDDATPVSDIEYDLDIFANEVGASPEARRGADQVGGGIVGKVPRGRARATACFAMELLARPAQEREAIVKRFGAPGRPRQWTALGPARTARELSIAASYDVHAQPAPGAVAQAQAQPAANEPAGVEGAAAAAAIDFAAAQRSAPKPKKRTGGGGKGGPKKVDHKRRQERNGEIGRLGEEFALGYERWRLAGVGHLAAQVKQVSLEDDTLGYDIRSFEPNGSDRWVEVKASEGPLATRFFLSANELAFAEANQGTYVVLRVAGVRHDPTFCELRPPFDELDFKASVYECTFKPSEDNAA